ncbi:MAG: hypothetical protein L0Y71_20315 [Gemmataceae bacterium]|nr:hypothetical protein [Gemmataceae bacterium]
MLAVCAFSYWWWGYTKEALPPPNAGLVVDAKELDFGEAWEDRAFPWKFAIRNSTDKDVKIIRFWSGCSCVSVTPELVTIPAGGNAHVALVLDLTAAFWEKSGATQVVANQSKRSFEAEISPQLADGPTFAGQHWTIRGNVARVLTVSRAFLQLDEGFICGEHFPTQQLKATAHVPLAGIVAKCPIGSGHEATVVCPSPDANEWEVRVAVRPDLRAGPFKFDLTLVPVRDDGRALPSQVIPVRGTATESVRAIPSTLVLGLRQVGTIVEDAVTLESLIGLPFEVLKIESNGSCTEVRSASTSGAYRGTRYLIRQRVSSGSNLEAVRFHVRSREREFQVNVNMAYHGNAD